MQIQALNSYNNSCHFMGVRNKTNSENEIKQMSNEEVLEAAKLRYAKTPPVFTPSQRALMPEIELFKSTGILDIMQEGLDEIDEIEKEYVLNDCEPFEKDGKFYDVEREDLSYNHGRAVRISVSDEDGIPLYKCSKKTYGGYSQYSVQREFEDYGKVTLSRQGVFGNEQFIVNNLKNEHYIFGGNIDEDGAIDIDYITNLRD